MGLLDREESSNDLFGGDPTVLLRWENVYYRAKSCHLMLKAPGRILWYSSDPAKEIIGISRLDEVAIDTVKSLFKRFKKFGVLEWKDVFKIGRKDLTKEIMALKFSQTVLFDQRIPLAQLRDVYQTHGLGESLQSPSHLPFPAFADLFHLGFSNPT